jgi:hypothetical protein
LSSEHLRKPNICCVLAPEDVYRMEFLSPSHLGCSVTNVGVVRSFNRKDHSNDERHKLSIQVHTSRMSVSRALFAW